MEGVVEGQIMTSAFTLFMTMLHILFSQNNQNNHCPKKQRFESRMLGGVVM